MVCRDCKIRIEGFHSQNLTSKYPIDGLQFPWRTSIVNKFDSSVLVSEQAMVLSFLICRFPPFVYF